MGSAMTLVETIINNLCARSGFDAAFDLDEEILGEVKQEMAEAIDVHLANKAGAKVACVLCGLDEFGPMIEWHKHWSKSPIGT